MSLSALFDLLFPPRCVGCGGAGAAFCESCVASLQAPVHVRLGSLPCLAMGTYEGVLRAAVLRMKRGRRDVGERLGSLLARRAGVLARAGACLVPAPTAARRRGERGFDQASLLARAVGRELGVPVCEALSRSVEDAQRGRSRGERLAAAGRFAPAAAWAQGWAEQAQIVLVDDVATTGATLRDAAVTLRSMGAEVRGGLVVAYALAAARPSLGSWRLQEFRS